MRRYNITVNGKTYEVEVEEIGGNLVPRGHIRPAAAASKHNSACSTSTGSSGKSSGTGTSSNTSTDSSDTCASSSYLHQQHRQFLTEVVQRLPQALPVKYLK